MAILQLWISVIGNALLSLLLQPFFYIALLAMGLLMVYRTKLERLMFHVKLYPKLPVMVKSLVAGIIVAIIVSVIAGFLGLTMTKDTIILVVAIQIILMLFKLRFSSIVYSASLIIVVHESIVLFEPLQLAPWLQVIYEMILNVSSFSLALIVGMLIVAQSILLKIQGKQFLSPIYVAGKRGKIVGGYTLQSLWTVPLLLFAPVEASVSGAIVFDTTVATPFFLEAGPEAWLLVAMPLMIGSSSVTTTLTPERLINRMFWALFISGLVTVGFVVAVWWLPLLIWGVPILILLSCSIQRAVISSYEANHAPIYMSSPIGLRVLSTIDKSTSERLQIKIGEVIKRVNAQEVNSVSDLYDAIALNPAFCKLEVLDKNGEIRFVQRARYENEHHQLGLILVPHQQVSYIKSFKSPSFLSVIKPRIMKRNVDNSEV